MVHYTFSATQWIFGNEELEKSLQRLKKFGYDGVELAGEPDTTDADQVNRLLAEYGMICTSICGIYTAERDLSSTNERIRSNAVQYVKACVDLARRIGAAHVIVVPSPVGKLQPETTQVEEWRLAVQSVREAGEYALSQGVRLCIEALNRYETYLVNHLADAKRFLYEVSVASVHIMADLFHMNIEERNTAEALRSVASELIHVHIADNTREAAGLGQTDFASALRALTEIGYKGPLTMEFLPPISNPYLVSGHAEKDEMYDDYTERSIRHIRQLLQEIK